MLQQQSGRNHPVPQEDYRLSTRCMCDTSSERVMEECARINFFRSAMSKILELRMKTQTCGKIQSSPLGGLLRLRPLSCQPSQRGLYRPQESYTLLLIALKQIHGFIEFLDKIGDDGLLRRFGREYQLEQP